MKTKWKVRLDKSVCIIDYPKVLASFLSQANSIVVMNKNKQKNSNLVVYK